MPETLSRAKDSLNQYVSMLGGKIDSAAINLKQRIKDIPTRLLVPWMSAGDRREFEDWYFWDFWSVPKGARKYFQGKEGNVYLMQMHLNPGSEFPNPVVFYEVPIGDVREMLIEGTIKTPDWAITKSEAELVFSAVWNYRHFSDKCIGGGFTAKMERPYYNFEPSLIQGTPKENRKIKNAILGRNGELRGFTKEPNGEYKGKYLYTTM